MSHLQQQLEAAEEAESRLSAECEHLRKALTDCQRQCDQLKTAASEASELASSAIGERRVDGEQFQRTMQQEAQRHAEVHRQVCHHVFCISR